MSPLGSAYAGRVISVQSMVQTTAAATTGPRREKNRGRGLRIRGSAATSKGAAGRVSPGYAALSTSPLIATVPVGRPAIGRSPSIDQSVCRPTVFLPTFSYRTEATPVEW
jgi:hypothetical protein